MGGIDMAVLTILAWIPLPGSPLSLNSTDDAIISKDLNGIITSWNLGAERIFGYRRTKSSAIHSEADSNRPDREEDYILGLVRTGERIKQYDTIRRCKDGRLIHVSLTISPIRNQDNVIVGVSKIARDITERKLAQETQPFCFASSITARKISWRWPMPSSARPPKARRRKISSNASAAGFMRCRSTRT